MEIQLPRPISRIVFRGCSEQTETQLRAALPIHAGAMLSAEFLEQARETAKRHNGRLGVLVREDLPPATDDSVSVIVLDPASPPERIRVQGTDQEANLIEKTPPASSDRAGVVTVAVVIGKDGTVIDVNPFPGPQSLTAAAVDAVRRWKYKPTLLNGRPVEVETTVDVNFPPGE